MGEKLSQVVKEEARREKKMARIGKVYMKIVREKSWLIGKVYRESGK